MDAALLQIGFAASSELLAYLSRLDPGVAMDRAVRVTGAVRELVGDHVAHNAYFIDFPEGVPDTVDFWVSCRREAVAGVAAGERRKVTDRVLRAVVGEGWIDLLTLPRYGRSSVRAIADLSLIVKNCR